MIGTTYIREVAIRCRIGCDDDERRAWQPVIIDLTCETDMSAAVASDRMKDCVDYVELHRIILTLAEETNYWLLESLAYAILRASLALPHVRAATVDLWKPHKLSGSAAVGITLTLRKEEVS